MKVKHSTIISSVEFNGGFSISIGDWLEGYSGTVTAINIGVHSLDSTDLVQVVIQDGDEGYSVYFNEDGDEVSIVKLDM